MPTPLPGRIRAWLAPCRQRTPTAATPLVPALLSHWLPGYVGRGLSYPLYLTHWPVLVLLRRRRAHAAEDADVPLEPVEGMEGR